MTWTLLEWAGEAVVVWLVVSFLKRIGGVIVSERCLIPNCQRMSAVGKRGLCLVCYSQAKKKVDNFEVSWEQLAQRGLCKPESSPFDDAYSKAMENE